MDIIKKLGITPEWKCDGAYLTGKDFKVNEYIADVHPFGMPTRTYEQFADIRLIAAAPDMLEWLIKDLLIQDIMGGLLPDAWREQTEKKFGKQVADWIEYMKPLQTDIVEKATGKSWNQLKELINANTN